MILGKSCLCNKYQLKGWGDSSRCGKRLPCKHEDGFHENPHGEAVRFAWAATVFLRSRASPSVGASVSVEYAVVEELGTSRPGGEGMAK